MKKSCKSFTTLGIGNAQLPVFTPENDVQLCDVIRQGNYAVLGRGSNILGTDDPLFSLNIIQLSAPFYTQIKEGETPHTLKVGAGVLLYTLARYCVDHQCDICIPLAGIPATLGGAIFMNASAHGCSISDHLISVRGWTPQAEEKVYLKEELQWYYHKSGIPSGFVMTEATFKFDSISCTQQGRDLFESVLLYRREHQPKERSCGCVFRNPTFALSAGKIIDECGLKGFSVGDAKVSEKHANFLVNTQSATENDFICLLEHVEKIVKETKNLSLERELIFIKELKK